MSHPQDVPLWCADCFGSFRDRLKRNVCPHFNYLVQFELEALHNLYWKILHSEEKNFNTLGSISHYLLIRDAYIMSWDHAENTLMLMKYTLWLISGGHLKPISGKQFSLVTSTEYCNDLITLGSKTRFCNSWFTLFKSQEIPIYFPNITTFENNTRNRKCQNTFNFMLLLAVRGITHFRQNSGMPEYREIQAIFDVPYQTETCYTPPPLQTSSCMPWNNAKEKRALMSHFLLLLIPW